MPPAMTSRRLTAVRHRRQPAGSRCKTAPPTTSPSASASRESSARRMRNIFSTRFKCGLLQSPEIRVLVHPERTREGSGSNVGAQILRGYAQDDIVADWPYLL